MNQEFYNISKEDAINRLDGDTLKGLTSQEVIRRIKSDGYNELPKKQEKSIVSMFFDEVKSPLELVLIVTVILSFVIGEVFDAFVLIFIILVDVIIGTIEEYKARKDANSLLNLIKVTSRVA